MSQRVIGPAGVVATIVGFVVGASIFVLPGSIAAEAGPGAVNAYILASILGGLSCLVAAEVGTAYRCSGASVVATTEMLGPMAGFLFVWVMVGAASLGIGLLAFGLADYLDTLVRLPREVTAVSAVVLFTLFNLAGARTSVGVQAGLVIAFLLALILIIASGLPSVRPALLSPWLPNGWSPVLQGMIPAYFSFTGFIVVIEIAGDIKRPERTIPLALAWSLLIVVLSYALVTLTLVGLVPWESLARDRAPLRTAALEVLPTSIVGVITLTAIAAAASSINGVLLGYSRDIAQLLTQLGVFGSTASGASINTQSERVGVLLIGLLGVGALAIGSDITTLAVQTVIGVLMVQVMLGMVVLLMPQRAPQRLTNGAGLLPRWVRLCASVGLITISVAAGASLVLSAPEQLGFGVAYTAIGIIVFLVLKHSLANTTTANTRR